MQKAAKNWWISLIAGVILIIAGVLAIGAPAYATLTFELVLGSLLLIGGVFQLIISFTNTKKGNFWPVFLLSLLMLVAGYFFIFDPLKGAVTITLLLAIYFFASGVFQAIFSFTLMKALKTWWLFLISGLVSIALGWMVFAGWPYSAAWFLGVLVGVYFIVEGITRMVFAFEVRQLK